MKLLVTIVSIALLVANLVLAAILLQGGAGYLKPWMTFLSTINAVVVAALGFWGMYQSREREALAAQLLEGAEELKAVEVRALLLFHRYSKEKRKPYDLSDNFRKDGTLHECLRILRTARLVVSLHHDPKDNEWKERGRFRPEDKVQLRPWAKNLCAKRSVDRLNLTTADEKRWIEIRKEIWDKSLSGIQSEIGQRERAA